MQGLGILTNVVLGSLASGNMWVVGVDSSNRTVTSGNIKIMRKCECTLKEKFGLFVDFELLTEMGSWGTD